MLCASHLRCEIDKRRALLQQTRVNRLQNCLEATHRLVAKIHFPWPDTRRVGLLPLVARHAGEAIFPTTVGALPLRMWVLYGVLLAFNDDEPVPRVFDYVTRAQRGKNVS